MNFNLKNNYQTGFLVLLSVVILFQFYQLLQEQEYEIEVSGSSEIETYNESESDKEPKKKSKGGKKIKAPEIKNNQQSSGPTQKYGNPTDIFDDKGNRIVFWKFPKPIPWSSLYFNQTKNTYTYGLNYIISKEKLEEWNKVIPNLGFNDSEKQIMITTQDEESALAVINLVLSTVVNELTIKEIMDTNLIDISVSKIRAHPLVKSKILEQINEKISSNKEKFKPESNIDLATNKVGIGAYGGNEFSFI